MPKITKVVPAKSAPKKVPIKRKSDSVIDRIGEDWPEDEGLRILLYGMSGTGKTTVWSTFPAPILVMLCSGGQKPGELWSVKTPENKKRIKPVSLRNSEEVSEVMSHYRDSGEFKTLVLDHASGFQDMVLAEILGLEEIPAQKSWGLASQQQYGQLSLQVKTIFREMLGLPGNIVIVAQERVFGGSDESTSDLIRPTVGAAMSPSIVGWLNPAVDLIVETFKRAKTVDTFTDVGGKKVKTSVKDGVVYSLRVGADETYTTKFRVPKSRPLPTYIDNPDYAKIRKAMQG